MGIRPFTHAELSRTGRTTADRTFALTRALVLCVVGLAAVHAGAAMAEVPSRAISGLRATCMETCREKENATDCALYCNCHLFELRRDLSDSQVVQLLLTAERGGDEAPTIRKWLHASAKVCEKRVFGEPPVPAAEPKPEAKLEPKKDKSD